MKKKHLWKIVAVVILCAAILMPFVPVKVEAMTVDNFDTANFEGLNFSLIGDSISTFDNINDSAQYNPDYYTYDGVTAKVYYHVNSNYGVQLNDTWWKQAVDITGMNLLTNNGWSGSAVLYTKGSTEGAYIRRSAYLHNGTKKPDIIAMYLGTNDLSGNTDVSSVGTVNSSVISNAEAYVNDGKTAVPATILEAYAIMLYRAIKTYPNAEIYCFTLLPEKSVFDYSSKNSNSDNLRAYLAFNAGVTALTEHYGNVHLVDLFHESGVHQDVSTRNLALANNLHPNAEGMDAITNCLLSSMIKNSKYMGSNKGYRVSYDLGNTYVKTGTVSNGEAMYGDVTAAIANKAFSVELSSVRNESIDYKVMMAGRDITQSAVRGNTITIDKVTGNIEICATALNNYIWEAGQNRIHSNPNFSAEYTYATADLAVGTYNAGGNFNYLKAANAPSFKLNQPVYLRYTRPWVMEFTVQGLDLDTSENTNGGFQGGILLTSDTSASNVQGNLYIHLNQTQFLLGYADDYDNDGDVDYRNTGYGWDQIAVAAGSSAGDTFRNGRHTYRLENKILPDGTNMIYLSVDGKSVGAMNAGEANAADISGKDAVVNYLGSSTHPLQATGFVSFAIYENGDKNIPEDTADNFRWAGIGDSLTSAESDDYFTYNEATLEMGSGLNGVHRDPSYYSLQKPITLLHDRPWTLEWRAKGDWGQGAGEDPMILSTVNGAGTAYPGAFYLWRNSYGLIAFGCNRGYTATNVNGGGYSFDNYGVDASVINGAAFNEDQYYVYTIRNRIEYNSDGSYKSNMPYLYINDVEIGPMISYYQGNLNTGTTDTFLSGKDMSFSYLGNAAYPISGVTIEYIQVWENGEEVDTTRLQYLYNNRLSDDGYSNWNVYQQAVENAESVLSNSSVNQATVDEAVKALMEARNLLIKSADETKIYSAELVTGEYARLGKQTGLKVITSADVSQICVDNRALVLSTGQIQKLLIDGVEQDVKVWLVTFFVSEAAEGEYVEMGIGARKTNDPTHAGTSSADAFTTLSVYYTSNYVTDIRMSKTPDKVSYADGEDFDPEGMEIQIKRKSGDWQTVTDYRIVELTVSNDVPYVTVEYEGASLRIALTVT